MSKQTKTPPTHDAWGNPIESLAAMKKRYELLDGDAPENQTPLPTTERREWFFSFASDVVSAWMTLPQVPEVLEERTLARIERQREFRKIGNKWRYSVQP